jgi:PDGLE domain
MKWFTILALALAIGLATAASPFASASPDGLERVASENGFAPRAETRDGPLGDYSVSGVDDARVATGLAGFAGTLIVFALAGGVATVVRRR